MVPLRVPPPPTLLSGKRSGLAPPEPLPGGDSEPIAVIGSPEDRAGAAAGMWLGKESVRAKDRWAGCPGPAFCEGIP